MKKKSLITSSIITLCIIFGLSLNVIASNNKIEFPSRQPLTPELLASLEQPKQFIDIYGPEIRVLGGIAKKVSASSNTVVYEASDDIKKGVMDYCKDVVRWVVKDSKIVDVSVRQEQLGIIMKNGGIEKIQAASSEKMCTIIAKHNFKICGSLKGIKFDYRNESNNYWRIYSDGRYEIKRDYDYVVNS